MNIGGDEGIGGEPRTDPAVTLKGRASMEGLQYEKSLGPTPLGEVWQVRAASGEGAGRITCKALPSTTRPSRSRR